MAKYVLGFKKSNSPRTSTISIESVEASNIENAIANSRTIKEDPLLTSDDIKVVWEIKSGDNPTEISEKIYQCFFDFWN